MTSASPAGADNEEGIKMFWCSPALIPSAKQADGAAGLLHMGVFVWRRVIELSAFLNYE